MPSVRKVIELKINEMNFIKKIFRRRKQFKPQPKQLRIDGVKTTLTPTPDDAELAAQALLESRLSPGPSLRGRGVNSSTAKKADGKGDYITCDYLTCGFAKASFDTPPAMPSTELLLLLSSRLALPFSFGERRRRLGITIEQARGSALALLCP